MSMDEPNKFYRDIEEIVIHWKRSNPYRCHILGIHDYDGLLPDYSYDGIQTRIIELKEDIVHLIALKRDYTIPYTIFEFNLLKFALEQELYELDVYKEYTFNPLFFIRPLFLIEQNFVPRSFASITNRTEILIQFLNNIPNYLLYPKEHLKKSLPHIHLELSINTLTAIKTFISESLDNFVNQLDDINLINNYVFAKNSALKSITAFLTELVEFYKPNAHQNFTLGKEIFLQMLKKREFVTIDEQKLKELGEFELEKDFTALQTILKRKTPNYLQSLQSDIPATDELFSYTNSVLNRLVTFLDKSNLVDLPTKENCKIAELPEFLRGIGFGLLDSPGPFEQADLSSYFYLSLPDKNWTDEQSLNYMKFFNKASFEIIAINQVWPGHYLKYIFERKKTKSIISNLFSRAESMREGYPNYCQEMMIEQNYNPWPEDKDKIRVGHLLVSLLRTIRFVTSVGIHCFDMTINQALNLFIEKAYLSKESALVEVNRVIVSQMVVNYLLGKILIKKLKIDYKKEKGDKFDIKSLHNELLSYGNAPITILRLIMIEDQKLANDIL